MQNTLKIYLGALSAVFFYSCSDNSTVEPDPTEEGPCRVAEMSLEDERIEFFYNEDYKLDSMLHYEGEVLVGIEKVVYSGTRAIDIYSSVREDFEGAEFEEDFHTRLELNQEGRLVKESYIYDESGWPPVAVEPYIHDYDTLIYDEGGKLVEVQHWNSGGDPATGYYLYAVSTVVMDDNLNIVSVKYVDQQWDEETNYHYIYDDKKRVSEDPALLHLLYSGGDHADGEYLSRNNVLTETIDDGQEDNYTYTYIYNKEGRPINIKESGEIVVVTYEECD